MPSNIAEPTVAPNEILLLKDEHFIPSNVCLVTGAGSGIGRAVCIAATANGLRVAGVDINPAGLRETEERCGEFGTGLRTIVADLTRDADVERAVGEAASMGAIRYLANIAGIQYISSLEEFPMDKYDLMQKLMLRAPFLLSKLCIPHMKGNADGVGVIGNMASMQSHISTVNKPAYNALKFGLRGLTQSISAEGQGRIRSFSVSPSFVKTPMTVGQVHSNAVRRGISDEEMVRDVILGRQRIKEIMNPIEVANLFLFGFSRFARFLFGADLLFDGGAVLTY
jgi:3-hydroxybutyrate dehydrogenase